MAELDPGPPHVDVAGYVLGTLDAGEREAFAAHLATCAQCRRELEELRGMPGLLEQAAEPVDVPVGLESRVMVAVAREPARPAAPAAPRPTIVRPGRARPPRLAWVTAAAAAVVLAFVGGLGLGRGLAPVPTPAPTQAPVLTNIHLVSATGSAASGNATIRSTPGGKSIELTVRDLPPPPPGFFYTCWLVGADDTLQHQNRVSVGSFVTPTTGAVTLRWETAADLARYPHLGVTLEPDNGNPLHQGPKVLAGP
jgi:anti-sigma-K factor RskA